MVKVTIILLIGLILLSSCGGDETGMETEITVPVSVEEIKLSSIEEFIVTTGTVYAAKDALVKSENQGVYDLLINPATNRRFALGDYIQRDQEIIRLKNQEIVNTIKIDARELHLDVTKREFEKQKSLYEKGGVTLGELKTAEREYINARYDYQNALIELSKLKITAPFDGIIVDLPYYTPGTQVETGSEMVHIMDYSRLYLEVNLPGKDLGRISTGQSVRVMNYTMPDDTLGGQVTQVSPAIDPETRSFKATIDVDNLDLLFRPGMFIRAEIIIAHKDSVVVIPKNIILSKSRGKTVFIVEKGAARERVLKLGLENPSEAEVTEGLKENERLVVKGFEALRNRSKVKIIR